MKISRRNLLLATLGATQLGLLDRFGMLREARADTPTDAPTKLLTIYLQGGWRPQYFFCPFSAAEADQAIPPPGTFDSEPTFFRPDQLADLASGDGTHMPLRVARTWDETRAGYVKTKYGQSFETFDLAHQIAVLHGIDQGTNAHASGYIASMCGVAGSNYRAPALSCVAAEFLSRRFPDRPLPCVVIDVRGSPEPLDLPASAAPILVPDAATIRSSFSTDPAIVPWWKGLDARTPTPVLDFAGKPAVGTVPLTRVESYALDSIRAARAKSSAGTDAMLEQLYGNTMTVSKVLARDIATALVNTKGLEFADEPTDYFSFNFGANYGERSFGPSLDMVLRLLKSDLTSSIHAYLPQEYFDTHAGEQGQNSVCARQRGTLDVIGRLLGEMKRTPAPGKPGRTLLDDTLVLVFSEFGRTPARGASQSQPGSWSYGDDHHPYTSVVFAGGGVAGNRQIGSYTTDFGSGVPIAISESDGSTSQRVPRAADSVSTALRILGLELKDFFLPGGYGEAMGIRAGT